MPMKKNSTFIFLIKKIYSKITKETDLSEEMSEDDLKKMEKAGFSPSEETIQKIIDFARTYDVLETVSAGQVEMNLN
jgi:SepF-like predicted cell division protein (DUF552 family)